MNSVVQRIVEFNAGRNPILLDYKYHKMQKDGFTFFRGTCHLFYEDWSASPQIATAPLAWICGDLHLENFGSYRDETGSVRFNINDFDDAILAPCTWDLVRMLTSVQVAAHTFNLTSARADLLCESFLDAYIETLQTGQVGVVDAINPPSAIQKLMIGVQDRGPRDVLDDRTKKNKKRYKRELKIIKDRTMAISLEDESEIAQLLHNWRDQQPEPIFDKVSDVIHRISGTGSLGLRNYVILVEVDSAPEEYAVLHLKQAANSALAPYVTADQPNWGSQARRVISTQRRIQGSSPLLVPIGDGEHSYVLRYLQPSADRIAVKKVIGKPQRLKSLVNLAGQVVAWDQLRSANHDGAAPVPDLITFAQQPHWRESLLNYARSYVQRITDYYAEFCAEDASDLAKR